MKVMIEPLLSGSRGGGIGPGRSILLQPVVAFSPIVVGVAILLAAYAGMLLYGMGQKTFYMDLLRGLLKRPSVEVEQPVVTQEA